MNIINRSHLQIERQRRQRRTSNYEELLKCLRVHYFYKLSTMPSQEKILETSRSILNSFEGKKKICVISKFMRNVEVHFLNR
jgi:hypothetical protein